MKSPSLLKCDPDNPSQILLCPGATKILPKDDTRNIGVSNMTRPVTGKLIYEQEVNILPRVDRLKGDPKSKEPATTNNTSVTKNAVERSGNSEKVRLLYRLTEREGKRRGKPIRYR